MRYNYIQLSEISNYVIKLERVNALNVLKQYIAQGSQSYDSQISLLEYEKLCKTDNGKHEPIHTTFEGKKD